MLQEEGEAKEAGGARGGVLTDVHVLVQNFSFFYGCEPNTGVKIDTKMVEDITSALELSYSKVTFSLDFPDCFEALKSSDANLEMVASNTL